jgi:o-succinylbenzoate synthase
VTADGAHRPTPLPPVPVTEVALVRTRLALVRPFTTAFGRQTERDVLLVRVTAGSASGPVVGWGECTTTSAPVYNEEFTDGAALVLADHLVPALLGPGPLVDGATLRRRLAHVRGHAMARAALEVAVVDAQLRAVEHSLASHLGAIRDRVPAGVSVGIPDGPAETAIESLVEEVVGHLDAGYVRVKVKVRPGFDVDPVTRLRTELGDDVALQVDANTGYDPDDPGHVAALDALDELGLVLLEQPFAPGRLRAHARHAARWRTPVCLDESIHDADDAADAIALGACHVVNVKLGRVGGLAAAVAIRDVCRAAGVPVWCGGMLESGIGRAANLALAALDGFDLPADLSASDRYWHQDLTVPFVLDGGHLAVPDGPGIGRVPLPDRLAEARVSVLGGW